MGTYSTTCSTTLEYLLARDQLPGTLKHMFSLTTLFECECAKGKVKGKSRVFDLLEHQESLKRDLNDLTVILNAMEVRFHNLRLRYSKTILGDLVLLLWVRKKSTKERWKCLDVEDKCLTQWGSSCSEQKTVLTYSYLSVLNESYTHVLLCVSVSMLVSL